MSGVAHISAQIDKLVASFRLQTTLSAPLSRILYGETEMSRAFHNLAQLAKHVASFRLEMTLLAPRRTREKTRNESRAQHPHSSRQTYSQFRAATYSFVNNLSHAPGQHKQKNRDVSRAPYLRPIAHI